MIKKIISGGQTGAQQGALDAAIEFDIPYGGWLPKRRRTEDGPLEGMLNLKEMPTGRYNKRTEKNVVDSDGTLIISGGSRLTGGSAYTRKMAKKHDKPYLHINLRHTATFFASSEIIKWVKENDIEVLNVAGPRASKDPFIHRDVKKIIEGVYHFSIFDPDMELIELPNFDGMELDPSNRPSTVEEAVDRTLNDMSLKDKVTVAKMTEKDLIILEGILVLYVSMLLEEWTVNEELLGSCRSSTGTDLDAAEASALILEEIWKKLKVTHKLRVLE
ncbi:MAG: putative molybdenum carrier protein [Deltaproteobacteria bacterium]|nr:putative molybdenum carrier protein [Deltaproteobacteria bacterium]